MRSNIQLITRSAILCLGALVAGGAAAHDPTPTPAAAESSKQEASGRQESNGGQSAPWIDAGELARAENLCVAYDVRTVGRADTENDAIFLSVAELITSLDELGVDRDALEIHVVLRDEAVAMAMTDAAYARLEEESRNPHADDLAMLLHADVSIEASGDAIGRKDCSEADLLPAIKVVPNGIVRLIELQQRGCAYIHL